MYPVLLNIKDKPVLIVGGGRLAKRKLLHLLEAGARITIVSPDLHPDIPTKQITWRAKHYDKSDLAGFSLVLACTDRADLNEQIYQESQDLQWVNNTSNRLASDFYNQGLVHSKNLIFSVSSQGMDYHLTKRVTRLLDSWVKDELPSLLEEGE
ncbi:precorrin-2 dehydrogenase/sirohydrochlorin ferrochelatase family protein [Suicoccus acidiformans]|nr:NAD(P)-dependent oxidoreductase [Suicoccus acidiformans]